MEILPWAYSANSSWISQKKHSNKCMHLSAASVPSTYGCCIRSHFLIRMLTQPKAIWPVEPHPLIKNAALCLTPDPQLLAFLNTCSKWGSPLTHPKAVGWRHHGSRSSFFFFFYTAEGCTWAWSYGVSSLICKLVALRGQGCWLYY